VSKVIIGIHGLGNKPSEKTLKEWWLKSILEGLEYINKNTFKLNFGLIYWADVLNNKSLDETIIDKENPLYINEKYTPAPENFIPKPHPVRKKILGFIEKQMDKIFLNEDLSINYSFISDMIIHKYFKELEIYYTEEYRDKNNTKYSAKDVIRKKAADVLKKHKNDEIFLIAHSMGSIVIYDVLTFLLPGFKIDTLVTMGSPLGLPIIMSKIATEQKLKPHIKEKLKTPPGVKRNWYNFSDLEDKIAINYNLADDYDKNANGVKATDFVVNNNYEINGERNPHKSYGYLRTPEFSEVLAEFLAREKLKPGMRLLTFIVNSYVKTNRFIKSIGKKLNPFKRRDKDES
jgi:triacylglycerol esterase/lipase EstA (alpha/beta hydrolase family)